MEKDGALATFVQIQFKAVYIIFHQVRSFFINEHFTSCHLNFNVVFVFVAKKNDRLEINCKDDLIRMKWSKYEDKETGLTSTEWCLETVNGTCDIYAWHTIPRDTQSVSAIVPDLHSAIHVRGVVRLRNGVGKYTQLTSSLCVPKKEPPPMVNISMFEDWSNPSLVSNYQRNPDAIFVRWYIPENRFSNLSVNVALAMQKRNSFNHTIGKKWRGEPLVFDFVEAPRGKNNITFSGSRLETYVKYHVIVRVCNTVGLCTDSHGKQFQIVPDTPSPMKVITSNGAEGEEIERWQKYVRIPKLTRKIADNTLFFSDPSSLYLNTKLEDNNKSAVTINNIPVTYEARVNRVLFNTNETQNETLVSQQMFNNTHIYGNNVVCCSKENKKPRSVNPDRYFIPVSKTTYFGVSLSVLDSNTIVVSSSTYVYFFSVDSFNIKPIFSISLNDTTAHDSQVHYKAKTKNDTLLVSFANIVSLYKNIHVETLNASSASVHLTNCKYSMTSMPRYCHGDDRWSTYKNVGRKFEYDGKGTIIVSGQDPRSNSCVVAVFVQESDEWDLRQVIKTGENVSLSINHQYMVVASTKILIYTKASNSSWKIDQILSNSLRESLLADKTVYLATKVDLLLVLSKNSQTLNAYEISTTQRSTIRKCSYKFASKIELTGNLDVSERKEFIIAVGMTYNKNAGVVLINYDPSHGCAKIGEMTINAKSNFPNKHILPTVAISDTHLFLGTPNIKTWSLNDVSSGSGRLYVTTFCKRNHVRQRLYNRQQSVLIKCIQCHSGWKAFSGFEEECVNCINSVCSNSNSAHFKLADGANHTPHFMSNHTIVQNASMDNLTVTEWATSLENQDFYLPGSIQSYVVRLAQILPTGARTESETFPFSIDNTSPEPGSVFDGPGSDASQNCSANTTLSSKHQCTSRNFLDTDIDYTNDTSEISARWNDFKDNESNIAEQFWCIGSRPLSDDLLACQNATDQSNKTFNGLSLNHKESYYVTVIVCNYAGLCTAKSSDGVLVDTTPPVIHSVIDGLVDNDIDYQV